MATVIVALVPMFGCSVLEKGNPPPCPRISVLADAARMTRFRPGQGHDVTDVELLAEVGSFTGSCSYDMDKRLMKVSLQVGIDAERGPAAQGRQTDISYFVAMPTFYPKPEAKQVMAVSLNFPEGTNRVRYVDDEVSIAFPISEFKDLPRYEIFVGLQLSPAQLEYNRQNKRGM